VHLHGILRDPLQAGGMIINQSSTSLWTTLNVCKTMVNKTVFYPTEPGCVDLSVRHWWPIAVTLFVNYLVSSGTSRLDWIYCQ